MRARTVACAASSGETPPPSLPSTHATGPVEVEVEHATRRRGDRSRRLDPETARRARRAARPRGSRGRNGRPAPRAGPWATTRTRSRVRGALAGHRPRPRCAGSNRGCRDPGSPRGAGRSRAPPAPFPVRVQSRPRGCRSGSRPGRASRRAGRRGARGRAPASPSNSVRTSPRAYPLSLATSVSAVPPLARKAATRCGPSRIAARLSRRAREDPASRARVLYSAFSREAIRFVAREASGITAGRRETARPARPRSAARGPARSCAGTPRRGRSAAGARGAPAWGSLCGARIRTAGSARQA